MNFVLPYYIYPCRVMFSFGETNSELAAALVSHMTAEAIREGLHLMEPEDAGKTTTYNNGFTLVRMRVTPHLPEDMGVLAHEIGHAVINLMLYIGMPLSRESAEAYTYLIEYLTTEVNKRLQE
jgi:hypothetical protein